MLRISLAKSLNGVNGRLMLAVRASSSAATPAKAPEKIEVFVDDQSVFVEPGTTVLQVGSHSSLELLEKSGKMRFFIDLGRLLHRLVLRFHAFVIMSDWPLRVIVVCAWLRWKKVQNQLLPVPCQL